jgi:hypothetical protein
MSKKHVVFVTAQSLLIIVFVGLAISNFSLRRQLDAALHASAARFEVGDEVPRFLARDRANRPTELGGTNQTPTVLVFYAPGCHSCAAIIDEIVTKPSPNVTLVSVASPGVPNAEAKKVAPEVPLYFVDNFARSPLMARGRVVPQMLRLGAGGKVLEVCRAYLPCIGAAAPANAQLGR